MASSMLTAEVSASGSTEAEVDKALKASLLSCANDPDFAIICDFLQKFSKDLGLDLPNFRLLLQWLTKTDEVSPQLRDMQIKLLRKTRKTVHEKSWESALSKFCFTYSAQDGWEIERFGYKNSSVKVKLRILRELLECQFERNTKFRAKILTLSADSLRSKPIGRDRLGHAYWVTQDNDCNIRIYQEHLDEEIWHVVATNRDEFVNLLKRLKGSEVVQPCEDIDIVDEDTTSSSISRIGSSSVQKDLPAEEKFDTPEDEQKIPKLSIKLAFGKNSKETTTAKYLGKGEEELAAEEDAKLLKKSYSKADVSCEDEFEEIEEECVDECGSEAESEDEIIACDKITNCKKTELKFQKNSESKETNKKVEPLLISQNKILNDKPCLTSTNGSKKRTFDGKDAALSPKSENQEELKKFRPSLLHSKRSKFPDKQEGNKKVNESSEENEEEEAEEEDIDSAAAEEGENEEKLIEEYENDEEEEVGEEITDPVVKVMGEGSGKDCNVENNLYCIDYDLDNFVSPIFDDVIVEDVCYVYGEGNGKACLVGNIKTEKDSDNLEEKSLNSSITTAEIKSESQPEIEIPNKEINLEQPDNIVDKTIKPNTDENKDTDEKSGNLEEEGDKSEKNIVKNTEKPVDNNSEASKETNSQKINDDIKSENLSEDSVNENQLSNNKISENIILSDTQNTADEKNLEPFCNEDNNEKSDVDVTGQQTLACKMSALESLKKELRESKQKLLEKKLPQTTESANVKISSPSVCNRKRRFSDQTQTISARPESDVDLNSENNEDITNEKEVGIGESEQDVGGKRLKMRPKQTNSELRKKVEAQKIAIKDETTSSSGGEEDSNKQKKIVYPKKSPTSESIKSEENLQEITHIEDKLEKNDSELIENKSECNASNNGVATKPAKIKPTLAEIIENRLKKTPEKKQGDDTPVEECSNKEIAMPKNALSSLNKSPITKPLKKNVLIQIRQEANDEVPRKRCNSQDLNQTILSGENSVCSTPKDGEETSIIIKSDLEKQRNTPERQRKRRSSEETVQNDIPEEPEAKKEVTVIEETETLKSDKPHEAIKEEIKDSLLQTEKSLPVSGRRSGRRSGTVPNYVDASLSKRNRGTAKNAKEFTKCEKIGSKKEQPHEKLKISVTNSKSDDNKCNVDKKRNDASTTPPNKTDAKEVKKEISTNSVEKKATTDNLKSISTPKNALKGARKQREVDTTNIIDADSETPIRQSRRIAQQKIKEEAERRKLEEIALRTMKQELKKKKKAEKQIDPTVAPPTEPSSESEENDVEVKRKLQKKKFPGKNGNWSSGSEEQEEPEDEEEEPHHYETDPGSPLFKSDHEFSPESDIEDESQVVPMKRARTVRKEDADVEDIATNEAEEEACQKCNKSDHPEWILLCDKCDKGYHCSCLSPVLFYIPEGNWYCPPCQQEQLIKSLEAQLKDFDDLVEKKKEMEENEKRIAEEEKARQAEEEEKSKFKAKQDKKISTKKYNNSSSEDHSQQEEDDEESTTNSDDSNKSDSNNQSKQKSRSRNLKDSNKRYQRDRRHNSSRNRRNRFINRESDSENDSQQYSVKSNSISKRTSSSSSSTYSESDNEPIYKLRKRRQINVSYRLNEYDNLINSALKKEMDEVAGAGNLGRGKDISTIIEADKEEKARQKQILDGEEVTIEKDDNYEEVKHQDSLDNKLNEPNRGEMEEKIKQDESDSDAEPIIRKLNVKPSQRKKSRKLTTLDISSADDDDGSDEDFKGSSIEDDEEEDTSISASNSDSSLEIYKNYGKFKKKRRKAARRALRERRRNRRFLVDESDDEDIIRPKSKKKRKDESDYTESEADDDEISDLSENIDSADLCDDTTTDESDGAWRPNKRKKAKKSTNAIEQKKSPKLKNSYTKKPKRVEYSDDDVSDSEEDDDEEVGGSGKGYGKQPRSQPLKKSNTNSTKTKGKGKEKPDEKARNKKSSEDESSQSNSEDSTRRTRGRRYAYIEDFDDDSSDGGIKPGVQRPDTPPEEREKFIKRQEEIKRMLAEKNAEGAILAATPRLTPIKTDGEKDKKSPTKAAGDSLSTVPLSVIKQAKVLDIDYLQRRGENLDDFSNEVGEVGDDFDDADLPDDLPEDMDEDAIARLVEEEEEFGAAATRELPAPDDVLRTSNLTKQIKTKEPEKHVSTDNSSSYSEPTNKIAPLNLPAPSSNLQEPTRKRLPMPTIHPPLLRHQYLMHDTMTNTQHMVQRHGGPPSHLLQNALSAPLSQPLDRNYPPSAHHSINRIAHGIPLQSTVTHALNSTRPSHAPSSLINTKQSSLLDRTPQEKSTNPQNFTENKPRGRRKKITPLRDTLQKQQAAAAVTAATATSSTLASPLLKNSEPAVSSVIKTGSTQKIQVHSNVISSMHPTSHPPICRPALPLPPMGVPFVGADGPRFYDALGSRTSQTGVQRHRGTLQMPTSLLPPPPANRPSYGPPPPLKGSNSAPSALSSALNASASIRNPIQHIPPQYLGMPPNARHASHLNMFRPPIYGNPNFGPRSSLRPPNILAQEFTPGSRAYPPYGFYPPPPPLTTPGQRSSSGPISSPRTSQIHAVQTNITHPSTSVIVSAKSSNSPLAALKHKSNPIAEITVTDSSNSSKSVATKKEFSIKSSPPKPSSPTLLTAPNEKADALALSTALPRKKLTTLQAYTLDTAKKSPVLAVNDSSGSGSPGNPSTGVNDDSSTIGTLEITAEPSPTKEDKASEFSGLVSYFSSQHDDYNT